MLEKLSIFYFWLKSLWDFFIVTTSMYDTRPGLLYTCVWIYVPLSETLGAWGFAGVGKGLHFSELSFKGSNWTLTSHILFYCISFSPSHFFVPQTLFYVTVIWDWHYHCCPTLVFVNVNSHHSFFCLGQEVPQDLRLAVVPLLPVDHLTWIFRLKLPSAAMGISTSSQ